MTELWRPGAIGRLRLPHRIVMGSMHLGSEADADAGATLGAFYAERARGGAGLMVTGGWAVSRVGAGGASYGFVNEDAGARALEEAAGAVHDAGGLIALQLFHAGRYAFEEAFGLQPVAPSAVASRFSRATPAALDEDGVLGVIDEFVRGALRARELGFDAVEVMGSEGYLVDQFLSPLTNRRDDDWGGDAQRRRAFGVELTKAIRAAIGPSFPLIFRFTGLDLMPGGTPREEVLAFAAALAGAGADALNVGIGWHESAVPTVQGAVPPGAWWPVGEAVAAAVDVPVIAGNRIDTVQRADELLAGSAVAFASMARPFLADAALIERSRAGRPVDVCIACNQACIDRSIVDGRVSCMVNPRAGRERTFVVRSASPCDANLTIVVGGGPAGLEAARALATLGVRVRLLEAEPELGGQFRLARLVPGKEQFGGTIDYFARELERLGVDVRLNHATTPEDLRGAGAVVLATGVRPRTAGIEGEDLPHVIDYQDAFAAPLGERVVILGAGGIGVDLAHRVSHPPSFGDAVAEFRTAWGLEPGERAEVTSTVTVMRRSGRIGSGMGRTTRWVSVAALRRAGVEARTDVAYARIEPAGVRLAAGELVAADTVVIAAGQVPNADLRPAVEALGVPFRVVGGARDADRLDAVRAFSEGLEAAYALAEALGLRQWGPMTGPRVKICGVTSVEDGELAVSLGAWAVGLIFADSPRRCSPQRAQEIAAALRRRTLVTGVFLNHHLDEVVALHEHAGLDAIQLHGDEGPSFAAEVARRTGAKVIKAARVTDAGDVRALDAFRMVDFHLIDGPGRGQTVEPAMIRQRRSTVPLILAGGLTADNVAGQIEAVEPYAVDVASGVESAPGVKDPELLEAFFAAVSGATVPSSAR